MPVAVKQRSSLAPRTARKTFMNSDLSATLAVGFRWEPLDGAQGQQCRVLRHGHAGENRDVHLLVAPLGPQYPQTLAILGPTERPCRETHRLPGPVVS